MDVWLVVIGVVGGGVVSGLGTYVASRGKLRFDYDASLRSERIAVYTDLWGRLAPLAKYGRSTTLSGAEVAGLAASLSDWYFKRGGLFLSTAARTDYFALQDALARLAGEEWGWLSADRTETTPAAWEWIRVYGSRLRTALTLDVATRSHPRFPGDEEPFDYATAGTYRREDNATLVLSYSRRLLRGRRLSVVERSDPDTPRSLAVSGWEPRRSIARVLRGGQERILFVEKGLVVEGPPAAGGTPAPAALWVRQPDSP